MKRRFEGFYMTFYHVFALYLLALVAAYFDRYVGVTAFICVTVVLVTLIWIVKEQV
jgi:hypothetical protein